MEMEKKINSRKDLFSLTALHWFTHITKVFDFFITSREGTFHETLRHKKWGMVS
jgi:hypothetical protein